MVLTYMIGDTSFLHGFVAKWRRPPAVGFRQMLLDPVPWLLFRAHRTISKVVATKMFLEMYVECRCTRQQNFEAKVGEEHGKTG